MRRTLAVIALLGFSGAAFAAPADDTERTTLLRMISEGTAAIAAAAACDVDKDRIERATATQTEVGTKRRTFGWRREAGLDVEGTQ